MGALQIYIDDDDDDDDIKYSMCDLICDVISCCVWRWNMGKINVLLQNHDWKREKRKYGNQRYFNINLHPLDGLGIEFTAGWVELMTSFTVCDAYRYFVG